MACKTAALLQPSYLLAPRPLISNAVTWRLKNSAVALHPGKPRISI